MELKLFAVSRAAGQIGKDDEEGFMFELTLEQLALVGGARLDESPKE